MSIDGGGKISETFRSTKPGAENDAIDEILSSQFTLSAPGSFILVRTFTSTFSATLPKYPSQHPVHQVQTRVRLLAQALQQFPSTEF